MQGGSAASAKANKTRLNNTEVHFPLMFQCKNMQPHLIFTVNAPVSGTKMVNFTCQLGWVTGCPDIWSNLILGVSGSDEHLQLSKADRRP